MEEGDGNLDIGAVIKFYRSEKNMTQEELAQDICSVSYLSKIENNVTKPSEEIINLLFLKLKVEYDPEADHKDLAENEKELFEKYRGILNKSLESTILWNDSFKDIPNSYKTISDKVLFQIISCRFYLYKRDLVNAEKILSRLENIISSCNPRERFIYYKNSGIFFYIKGDYLEAISKFNCSLKLVPDTNIYDWDLADLYYQLSLTYGKIQKIQNSIKFAQMAIDYFDKDYNYIKSAECQVILGIAYQRLEEYDMAIKSYDLGLKLAETFNNTHLMANINHNLGYLYSLSSNEMKARKFFEESLRLRLSMNDNGEVVKILNTLHSLVQLSYKDGNFSDMEKFLSLAQETISRNDGEIMTDYQYHLTTYKLLAEDEVSCADYLDNYVIPYFINKGNKRYVYQYSKMLARIYESNRKYKKGIFYYSLANKTVESLIPKTIIE
jgi:HTH-type transcriptional regulator, quorum sensing regulator NprR